MAGMMGSLEGREQSIEKEKRLALWRGVFFLNASIAWLGFLFDGGILERPIRKNRNRLDGVSLF